MTVPSIRRPIQPFVPLGRANYFVLKLDKVLADGTVAPVVWNDYTKIVVTVLADPVVQVKSDTTPTAFDLTTNGRLVLKLGALGIPAGPYHLRVSGVKASGLPDELVHEESDFTRVLLPFVDTSTLV